MKAINILQKADTFNEYFNPKIIAELNGQQVKLVKIKGEFDWHLHENEDELFYVVKGRFIMDFRDRSEVINEGEIIVVPRGIEHRPRSEEEVIVMLFEPASTLNTGNIRNKYTVDSPDKI